MHVLKLLDSLQSTTCPAFTTSGEGHVMGLNGAAETLLGYESVSVFGRRCAEVFAGCDRFDNRFCLKHCAVREMVARNEAVNPFEVRLRTASGAALDVSISVVAVREEGRKRPAILHLLRPVQNTVAETDRSKSARLLPEDNEFTRLTSREHEVLALLAGGKNCHEMALAMGISLVTVRNHLKRIFPKLNVRSQAEAVSIAYRYNLI